MLPVSRFLSDADTYVPPDGDGMGFMLAEIENGADAVGGIPSTHLHGAGLLPHIRATVKLPMIVMKRTLQQLLGGAPLLLAEPAACFVLMCCANLVFRSYQGGGSRFDTDHGREWLLYPSGKPLHCLSSGVQYLGR